MNGQEFRASKLKAVAWLLAAISLASCSRQELAFVDKSTGIEISAHVSREALPTEWTGNPWNVNFQELPAKYRKACIAKIAGEFSKYPAPLIRSALMNVYLVGDLKCAGLPAGGLSSPWSKKMFLTYFPGYEAIEPGYLARHFHHELAHMLLLPNPPYLFKGTCWNELVENHGDADARSREAIANGATRATSAATLAKGYLGEYAMAAPEEDFCTIAENLFQPSYGFWQLVSRYPRLGYKVRLAMAYYHSINHEFTEAYFRGLADRE